MSAHLLRFPPRSDDAVGRVRASQAQREARRFFVPYAPQRPQITPRVARGLYVAFVVVTALAVMAAR